MSQLLAEWRQKKQREDEQLHDLLRNAVVHARRVDIHTDPKVLDFPGSPVHQHWDHLLPLTGLMTLALIILLATGVAIGIVAMTLCVLLHVFGNRHYVAWRLKLRTQSALLGDVQMFQTLWQMGGIALVAKGRDEPPCLAPKGDWRKFIRRNLGGAAETPEPKAPEQVTHQPMVVPDFDPPPAPPPPPPPMADVIAPVVMAPPPVPPAPEPPRTHWESIDDPPPRDVVLPPDPHNPS